MKYWTDVSDKAFSFVHLLTYSKTRQLSNSVDQGCTIYILFMPNIYLFVYLFINVLWPFEVGENDNFFWTGMQIVATLCLQIALKVLKICIKC